MTKIRRYSAKKGFNAAMISTITTAIDISHLRDTVKNENKQAKTR